MSRGLWGLLIYSWQINNTLLAEGQWREPPYPALQPLLCRAMRSLCCVSPGGFLKQSFLLQCRKWTWGALCKHPGESVSVWPRGHRHGGNGYGWTLPLKNQASYFYFTLYFCLCAFHWASFVRKWVGKKAFFNWKCVKTISGEDTHTHVQFIIRQNLINFTSKRSYIWFGNYLQWEKTDKLQLLCCFSHLFLQHMYKCCIEINWTLQHSGTVSPSEHLVIGDKGNPGKEHEQSPWES